MSNILRSISPRFTGPRLIVAGITALGVALTVQLGQSSAVPDGAPAPRAATVGLFADTPPVDARQQRDGRAVELGVRFRVREAGVVTGAQVYKVARWRAGTPTRASLWNARGRRIASASFDPKRGVRWVNVRFKKPVAVQEGARYTVSVFVPKGRYAATRGGLAQRQGNSALITTGGRNGVYRYGQKSRFPRQSHKSSNYWVDVMFRTADATTPTPIPTPTPTPAPGASGFPNASNTGVPDGTTLTPYTGPMTVTKAGSVIDAKSITGGLIVAAPDVTISRSSISGSVGVGSGGSLTISDSMIDIGDQAGTGLGEHTFTALRVHVVGGNRSINCAENCVVRDSYVHGQFTDDSGQAHESGIRMGMGSTIVHNTIACDAPMVPPDAGCSAPLTGYGDFSPVRDNLIERNLFKATPAWFCAYGGSSRGKAYSDDAANIRFIDNVFERGPSGKCGLGGPITDFDPDAPGNEWSGNVWDTGQPIQ